MKQRQHLSLVNEKGGTPKTVVREVVGVENLSSIQNDLVKKYVSKVGVKGVLVGALLGEEPWDLRPILIHESKLSILRFSNPAWVIDRNKLNSLRSIYAHTKNNSDLIKSIISYNEIDGQIWVLRRFHQNTLSNITKAAIGTASLHPVQQAQQLISTVYSLHSSGIIHGHINLNNVGADEDSPTLLDYGFGALQKADDCAPEIKAGLPPSLASDIFGLGQTLAQLLTNNLSEAHSLFLNRMLSHEPSERPSINEVKTTFFVETKSKNNITSFPSVSGKVITSGSFINAPAIRPPTNPPIETVKQNISSSFVNDLIKEDLLSSKASTKPKTPIRTEKLTTFIQPNISVPEAASNISANTSANTSERHLQARKPTVALSQVESFKIDIITPREKVRRAEQSKRELTLKANKKDDLSSTRFFVTIAMFTALISLLVGVGVFQFMKPAMSPKEDSDFEAFWVSGQPTLQEKVVEAAVLNNDVEAQQVIVNYSLKDSKIKGVREGLVKIAFNKAWINQLTRADKEIIFSLALEKPNGKVLSTLPPIAKASPAVIFSVLSQLEGDEPSLTSLPLSTFTKLPQPYGKLFADLEKLGIKQIGAPESRGLIRLINNDFSSNSVANFFGSSGNGKIPLLLPLLEIYDGKFALSLVSTLHDLPSGVVPTFDWFFEPSEVDWKEVSAIALLELSAGKPSFDSLSLEHELDLLSFPKAPIRQVVSAKLESRFGVEIKPVLKVIEESNQKLTRSQIVTLVSALAYKGQYSRSYISLWFASNPDPQVTLDLLMARNRLDTNDFFNLEASRYLADKDWDASFNTLKQMSVHLEQVARALAYSKMDPTDKEQLKFLRKMSNIEPSNTVRKGILEKIKPFEPRSTLTYQSVE